MKLFIRSLLLLVSLTSIASGTKVIKEGSAENFNKCSREMAREINITFPEVKVIKSCEFVTFEGHQIQLMFDNQLLESGEYSNARKEQCTRKISRQIESYYEGVRFER